MKGFICVATLLILWAGTASATNNWRYYRKECNNDQFCMKAQAAAYQEIKTLDKGIADLCKKKHVSSRYKDYSSALQCTKNEIARRSQLEHNRAEAREMDARANFLNDPSITIRHSYPVYGVQPQQRSAKPAPETTQERMERLIRERYRKKQ